MASVQMGKGFQPMGNDPTFRQEICEMIAGTSLFANFDWRDIEALSSYVQGYQVAAGTVVFKEGDAGSYMGLLIKGQIEILKDDLDGQPRRLGLVSCGKTVGEMSIIDGEPRSATCKTTLGSVLLVLTKDNYDRIIKEKPGLAVNILAKLAKLMSQRLRGVSGKIVEYLGQESD